MSELNKKYQNFMNLLEKNIKNADQLNLMKSELTELMVNIVDTMDRVITLEQKQNEIEKTLKNVQTQIENIEQDFYISDEDDENNIGDQMHDNDYEFEIICPYCGNGFVADNSFKYIKEIKCPQCKKVIELDWNGEDACHEDCNHCKSHCYKEDDEDEMEMAIEENRVEYTPEQVKKSQKSSSNRKQNKTENNSDKDNTINNKQGKDNKNNTEKQNKSNENEDDM